MLKVMGPRVAVGACQWLRSDGLAWLVMLELVSDVVLWKRVG
jgi:hypothetical protein